MFDIKETNEILNSIISNLDDNQKELFYKTVAEETSKSFSKEDVEEYSLYKEKIEEQLKNEYGENNPFIKIMEMAIENRKEDFYNEKFDLIVPIEICHESAKIPAYAHDSDAGMDIYTIEEITLKPGETKIIKTGLKAAIPDGYELQVRPRSGLSLKSPLRISNAPGTIDAGYRDEIGVICWNSGKENYTIEKGTRIAQFVANKVYKVKFEKVESVEDIGENRNGGFGSTGYN